MVGRQLRVARAVMSRPGWRLARPFLLGQAVGVAVEPGCGPDHQAVVAGAGLGGDQFGRGAYAQGAVGENVICGCSSLAHPAWRRCIGIDDGLPGRKAVAVTGEQARAERFAELFHAVYLTFHRRDRPRSELLGASRRCWST
jgi:hypothetical protein